MKITVIIAGWRTQGVIDSIKDLDAQTHKEFEVIIANDGQEELRQIVPDLVKDRPNYHFIDNYTRCHFYGAVSRNMATMMSFMYMKSVKRKTKEEFIVFHDDDVLFSNNLLEEMVDCYNRNNEVVMICPAITEIRGKINKDYRHKRKTKISPQNIDLNGLAFNRGAFIEAGLLDASARFKVSYDYELIKKMKEMYGDERIEFTKDSSLIFYHKRR